MSSCQRVDVSTAPETRRAEYFLLESRVQKSTASPPGGHLASGPGPVGVSDRCIGWLCGLILFSGGQAVHCGQLVYRRRAVHSEDFLDSNQGGQYSG